jgi:hypothetical protein
MSKAEEILNNQKHGFNKGQFEAALVAMKEIAELTWDKCWEATGEGWNGEIIHPNYMSEVDSLSYREQKQNAIKQLFEEEDI